MARSNTRDRSVQSLLLEGGVIVVSILLAFALDALWDETKRGREAQIALTSLRDEFEANLTSCEEVERHYVAMAEQFAAVLALSEEEVRGMDPSAAPAAYNSFCAPRTFDAMLGTTNSVISTGTFSILQDAELREALDTFLNFVEDSREDVNNLLHFMRVVGECEVAFGGPWGAADDSSDEDGDAPDTSFTRAITGAELLRLLQEPSYIGRVKLFQGCATWYRKELARMAAQSREVLEAIAKLQS